MMDVMSDEAPPQNQDKDGKSSKPSSRPEHGAESQLHCYNSVSWRLGQLFDADDEPVPPKAEK
jgi:hypothetical protein